MDGLLKEVCAIQIMKSCHILKRSNNRGSSPIREIFQDMWSPKRGLIYKENEQVSK